MSFSPLHRALKTVRSARMLFPGLITFAFMLVLSQRFYLERTVFADLSLHLFFILKTGTFVFQNHRYGAFFTQLFPVLSSAGGGKPVSYRAALFA